MKFPHIPKKTGWAVLVLVLSVIVSILILRGGLVSFIYPNDKLSLSEKEIDTIVYSLVTACSDRSADNRFDCYTKTLPDVVSRYGLVTSEAILNSLQKKDSLTRNCHVFGHIIGNESYNRAPWSFTTLAKVADANICSGGILHGVMATYIEHHPKEKLDGNLVNKLCQNIGDIYRQSVCQHIMGHLFVIETFDDVDKALPMCEGISPNMIRNCYEGAFMENHQKFLLSQHGVTPMPLFTKKYTNQLDRACFTYTGIIARSCWREMGILYMYVHGFKPQAIYNECKKAGNTEFVDSCYFKAIIGLIVDDRSNTKQNIMLLCSFYQDTNSYIPCLDMLVRGAIYNSPNLTDRIVLLCSSVEPKYTARCFSQLNLDLKYVVPSVEERKLLCNHIPSPYATKCVEETLSL